MDVGKGEHHAVGLEPHGKRLHDAPLPNTEAKLRALFDKLSRHGKAAGRRRPARLHRGAAGDGRPRLRA